MPYETLVARFWLRVRGVSQALGSRMVETGKNIELTTFVLTCCANIFVGCSVTPTFFGRSLHFLILSIILKNKKNLYMKSFNYFCYNIQIRPNCYMDTGVHDLEVAFF